MARVIVVGGGPAGLSAALFTSKNGLDVQLFDTDKTWLHHAHLLNYLGIESRNGDEFLADAREQVEGFGATLSAGEVTAVEASGDGFVVTVDDETHDAEYLVLATGTKRGLAAELGCAFTDDDDDVVDVDVTMETSVENVYATGAMVRAEEWQAIISAGDGAAAALNILTKERGEHFHDFDTPEDVE